MSTGESRLAAKTLKIKTKKNRKTATKRNSPRVKKSNTPSNNSSTIPNNVADLSLLQCKVCFLEFSSKYNLLRHEEYFNGARYPCADCGTKFADKKQLKIHFDYTHIWKTAEHRFRCHVCGQILKTAAYLQSHLYHYHDGGLQTPGTKNVRGRRRADTGNNEIVEELECPAKNVAEESQDVRAAALERSKDDETTKNSESTIPDALEKSEEISACSKSLGQHVRFHETPILQAQPRKVGRPKGKKKVKSAMKKGRKKTKRDEDNRVKLDDRVNEEIEHSSSMVPTLEEDLATVSKTSINTNESENGEEELNGTLKNSEKIENFRKSEIDNEHLKNCCPAIANEMHGLEAPEKHDSNGENKFETESEQPIYEEMDQKSKTLEAIEKLDNSIGEKSVDVAKSEVVTNYFQASFAEKSDEEALDERSLYSRLQRSEYCRALKKKDKEKIPKNRRKSRKEQSGKIKNTDIVRVTRDTRIDGMEDNFVAHDGQTANKGIANEKSKTPEALEKLDNSIGEKMVDFVKPEVMTNYFEALFADKSDEEALDERPLYWRIKRSKNFRAPEKKDEDKILEKVEHCGKIKNTDIIRVIPDAKIHGMEDNLVAYHGETKHEGIADEKSKTPEPLEKLDNSIGEKSVDFAKPEVMTNYFEASFAGKRDEQALYARSLYSGLQRSEHCGAAEKNGEDKPLENEEHHKKIVNTDIIRVIPDARIDGLEDKNEPEISLEISRNADQCRNTDNDRVLSDSESLQKTHKLQNSPQIPRYLENDENADSTAVIDDNYDSNEMPEQNLNVSDKMFVTSSKKSVDERQKHGRPRSAKHKCANFTAGVQKKGKKLTKNAVTQLNSVLAEVVAVFSEIDVTLPVENDEKDKLPEIEENIENAMKILDNSITNDRLQDGDSTFRFKSEMQENVKPREKNYFEISPTQVPVHEKNKSPSMENEELKYGESHLVTTDSIYKYDGGSFSREHPEPAVTRLVFSETNIDNGDEGAFLKNSSKRGNHEQPEKTSIFRNETISEKICARYTTIDVVECVIKSENVDSLIVVAETSVKTPGKILKNHDSPKHINNSENTVGVTIINGKNVCVSAEIQETEKSYRNYQNFMETENTDGSVVIKSEINDSLEKMETDKLFENIDATIVGNNERKLETVQNNIASFENVQNRQRTERFDETGVIRATNIIASEITQTNDKKGEYYENFEEIGTTEEKFIIDYLGDNIREKIGRNDDSTEHFWNVKNAENIEKGLVNHETRVETPVTVAQLSFPVQTQNTNEPFKTSKNHKEITDFDTNTLIITNNKISVIEKTLETCKPKQTPETNESPGNPHILENGENAKKTAVIKDKSTADRDKVQKTNISFENLQNPRKIHNSDNVVNTRNVDLHGNIQEIEKSSGNLHKLTKDSGNTMVVEDPILRLRGETQENYEALNKMESEPKKLNNVPLLTTNLSFGEPEVTQKNNEGFENLQNLTEMTKKDTTLIVNDHPDKNRLTKISGRIIASSETSLLPATKSADISHDIVPEPLDNRSKAYDRKKSVSKDDNELRKRYSCKDCYVSIMKINIENKYVRERRNLMVGVSAKLLDNLHFISRPYPYRVYEATSFSEASTNKDLIDSPTIVLSVICDKILPTVSSMRQHYHDSHSIGCDEKKTCACGKNMNVYEALEDHFFQHALPTCVSTTLPPFVGTSCQPLRKNEVCSICGKDFWLKTCLQLHSLECDKASLEFAKNTSIGNPLPLEFDQESIGQNELMCPICYVKFPTSAALWKHKKIYSKPANHRCLICGTCFMEKHLLDGHTAAAHTFNVVADYCCYCTICDQGFTKKIHRRVHRMHIHGEKYPTEKIKSSAFKNRSALDEDNTDGVSDQKCQICDLVFVNRKRFIEHAIFYKKNETLVCKICNQQFAGQYKAHRHNKLCHYSTGILDAFPHKCPVCQEGFGFKRHLQAHVSHIHGKNVDLIDLIRPRRNDVSLKEGPTKDSCEEMSSSGVYRLHICAICDISFPTIDLLAAHRVEYGDNGEFVCMPCGKKCGTATLLLDHLSLNHSSTIYDSIKCHRCDENFLTPAAWLSHVKHYHASDTREPSEFYLEMNLVVPKEFGIHEFDLIPKNTTIANGSTYKLMRSSINGNSLGNVTADIQDGTEKNPASIVNSSDVNVVTSGVDIERATDIEIIEETIETVWSTDIVIPDTSNEKTSWKCNICGWQFHRHADFARHVARYANTGPHMCEICSRRFTSMSLYREHMARHNRRRVKISFFCQMCKQTFDTVRWLKMHNDHLHGGTHQIPKPEIDTCVQDIVVPSSTTRSTSPRTLPYHNAACSTVSKSKPKPQTSRSQKPNQPITATPSSSSPADVTHIKMLCQPKKLRETAGTLSYIYQCPECTDKYFNLKNLRDHFRVVHKVTILDKIKTNVHAKTGDNVNVFGKVLATGKVQFLQPTKVSSEATRTAIADNNSPTDQLSITSADQVPNASNKAGYMDTDFQPLVSFPVTQQIVVRKKTCNAKILPKKSLALRSANQMLPPEISNLQVVQTHTARAKSSAKILTDEEICKPKQIPQNDGSSGDGEINNRLLTGRIANNVVVPTNAVGTISPPSILPEIKIQSNLPMTPAQKNPNKIVDSIKTVSLDSLAPMRCKPCDFVFPSMEMLRLHQKRVHSVSSPAIKFVAIGNAEDCESSISSMNNAHNRCSPVTDCLPAFEGTGELPISDASEGSSPNTQHIPFPTDIAELEKNVPPNALSAEDQNGQLQNSVVNSDAESTNLKILKVCSMGKLEENMQHKVVGKRKYDSTNNQEISPKKVKRTVPDARANKQLGTQQRVKPTSRSAINYIRIVDLI